MKINGNTEVSKVIKENKEAIKVIASLNSYYKISRIPLFWTLLNPRYTLEELATKVSCEIQFLLNELNKIGFKIESKNEILEDPKQVLYSKSRLEFIEDKIVKPLDLILILAQSKESLFDAIEEALKNLGPNEVLDTQSDSNPVFLTKLFEKAGFQALTLFIDGKYHVYFKLGVSSFQKDNARLSVIDLGI